MFDLVKRDGDDANRVIQGQLLVFDANNGRWLLNDKPPPSGMRLLVGGTVSVAQQWQGGRPVATVWPETVSSLVDVVEEGNESIPEAQWEKDQSGSSKKPWSISHAVYLVDPSTAKKFTVAASTVGQKIAVELLADQIDTMCRLRGVNVLPEITLGIDSFPTRFGTRRPRPDYVVVGWRALGSETVPALGRGRDVDPPTTAEVVDDEIPFS
jgi:hypothetical protein